MTDYGERLVDEMVLAFLSAVHGFPVVPDRAWHKPMRAALLALCREARVPSGGMIRAGDESGFRTSVRRVSSDVFAAMLDQLASEVGG